MRMRRALWPRRRRPRSAVHGPADVQIPQCGVHLSAFDITCIPLRFAEQPCQGLGSRLSKTLQDFMAWAGRASCEARMSGLDLRPLGRALGSRACNGHMCGRSVGRPALLLIRASQGEPVGRAAAPCSWLEPKLVREASSADGRRVPLRRWRRRQRRQTSPASNKPCNLMSSPVALNSRQQADSR